MGGVLCVGPIFDFSVIVLLVYLFLLILPYYVGCYYHETTHNLSHYMLVILVVGMETGQ